MKGFQKWYEYYKTEAYWFGACGGVGPAPEWIAEDAGFYEEFLKGQEEACLG